MLGGMQGESAKPMRCIGGRVGRDGIFHSLRFAHDRQEQQEQQQQQHTSNNAGVTPPS